MIFALFRILKTFHGTFIGLHQLEPWAQQKHAKHVEPWRLRPGHNQHAKHVVKGSNIYLDPWGAQSSITTFHNMLRMLVVPRSQAGEVR